MLPNKGHNHFVVVLPVAVCITIVPLNIKQDTWPPHARISKEMIKLRE